MSNRTIYLTPGFFLTLPNKRHSILFTQLDRQGQRATPARLALLDALNHGHTGTDHVLLLSVTKRFGDINSLFALLKQGGYLTESEPAPRFVGEPSGALGTVGNGTVVIPTPLSLVTQGGRYLCYDHAGTLLLRLTLPEVIALSVFSEPTTVADARSIYFAQENVDGLDAAGFDALVARIAGAGLYIPPPVEEQVTEETMLYRMVDRKQVQALVDARVEAHDAMMGERGELLVQVVPVNTQQGTTPASLGLVMAYAMEYDGGRLHERYNFVPMFLTDQTRLATRAIHTGVFIFSNYLWNVEHNLALSAIVKAVNPANITVHGGPSTPSYQEDCANFFATHSHVDIAVRGEGELTFADLLDKLDDASNLEVLKDVPGLTYRTADGVCRTGNRERISDLDTIPSAYLMGLFDEFGSAGAGAIIETNRGCPYGCTFCDWGSATQSKVRRFDLDRVYKELEWSAVHQIEGASIADANFGMLERDVEITEKIAELKREYGFPRFVGINYAKNQVKYLRQIIKIMADVNILTEGKVSLQTMDETTLKIIDRSNIKLEKYNELSTEFRRAKLPLAVEIMMGLPGSTVSAFHNDLQACTDRDIRAMLNPTQLLPNSPMNAPEYREKHGIVAKPGEYLYETKSFTRQEWDEMYSLRMAYYLMDSYGVLRYIARYVRRETGMREVEFYNRVRADLEAEPATWPIMSTAFRLLENYMAPPGSWGLFIEEVRTYLLTRLQLPDDSGLRTALAVQLAQLPAPGRVFPLTLELEHDYAAWWESILVSREEGHRHDWEQHTKRLVEFKPGTLTIRDSNEVCRREMGKPLPVMLYGLGTWELESSVARPRVERSPAAPSSVTV